MEWIYLVKHRPELASDCDWRGLQMPVTGKIDLDGHNLAVSRLEGGCEITDTNPVGYELLDYIESTGTQYILTGLKATATLNASVLFRVKSYVSNSAIFGCGVYNGNAYLFIMQSNQLRYFSTTATVFGSVPTKTDIQFSRDGSSITVKSGGTSQTTTIATSIGNLKTDAQKQIALFAMNDGSHKSKIRAYSYVFTEQDGTVLRNFVPARRLSDGKVGLLDLAHGGTVNEFYANAASGEDFTAGSVTNEVHAGKLHVDVAHGVTIQNTDVAITGSLTLVKDGAGTLVTGKTQTNIGGADICSGTLQYGVYPGAAGSPVTVYENAVFDLAGKSKDTKTQFVLAGGELRNTMADVGASTAQNYAISVVSNSTLNATTSVGMIGSSYAATTLDLGGNELDVGIASGKSFWLDNAAVTAGTLKLTGAGTFAIDKTSVRAAAADFDLGCSKVTVAVPTEVHDLTVQPDTTVTVSGTGEISVNGTYRPIGDSVAKYTLKSGATLDLSTRGAAFDVTGKTLAFADGATIFVIPGERGGWLVKWDALPTNVTFQLPPDQRGVLTVTDEGIFLDRGLTIFFR